MKKISMLALAVCGMTFGATAATLSGQTTPAESTPFVKVGPTESTVGPHGGQLGDPGIGVSSMHNAKTIGFSGLTAMTQADDNDVHSVNSPGVPGNSHSGMGVFNFAQVANAEVYFGEWSYTGQVDDQTHTAYYSGKDASTSVPTGGKASYQVAGISQYSGSNKLDGTLDADFGAKTLKGSISNVSQTVDIDANIRNNASFDGSATTGDLNGTTNGQFFGNNQESLAGVASFSGDHSKDTAFGGSKK
ncbi:TPA: Slam-dependent surface lipoprotein [Yersinia enterocolitica]|nr:transferrin-binding protein-like solute binding protein [Yersinia enterocolitica]HEN3636371.1 transferrin-binding protein-like solute binding protein [Yersinia enterocolitica]HEN3644498.1 transferrin-binding protein-like solute binding protein [Yersinia enterocolitica]